MFDPGVCDVVAPIVCSPLTAWLCEGACDAASTAGEAASGAASIADNAGDLLSMIMSIFTDPVGGTVKNFLIVMFSWLLVPTARYFDTSGDSVSHTIQHSWVLPIVVVFLTCGILWQGFQMVISRRGVPLIRVVKAVLMTAAAGGVATMGSVALLDAGDRFSCWVLGEALRGPNTDNPNLLMDGSQCASDQAIQAVLNSQVVDRLGDMLRIPAIFPMTWGLGLILGVLIGLIIAISTLIQLFLLVIRGGSLVILVGMSQLAAAGAVTRATSRWPMKLTGWMLALILYKPAAAMVYATALLLIDNAGGDSQAEVTNFIMGLTMLLLALFAMPALMKFFTWGFSALGRDGTLTGLGTGMDNLGDDAIRVGNQLKTDAGRQAQSIDSSLPRPVAVVETSAGGVGAARALGVGGGAAGGAGAAGGGGAAAAGAGAAGVTTKTTVFAASAAGAGAAAAPATMGTSLIVAGSVVGVAAATTQIGASLKRGITNHMDEDNE